MKAAQFTPTVTSAKRNTPFFNKGSAQGFFHSSINEQPFFSKTKNNDLGIQKKTSESKEIAIQRQEKPGESNTPEENPQSPGLSITSGFQGGSFRAKKCLTNPQFPDFPCLTSALKLDIDENLWNNAYHFYQAASLYPGDNELMWNTFLRYGLGVNLLKTSFGFAGVNKTWGTVLSYGTGVGLKSYEFLKNGKLELDVPIPLGKGINLDLKLDLNADPNNLTNVKNVNTGIGISGHF